MSSAPTPPGYPLTFGLRAEALKTTFAHRVLTADHMGAHKQKLLLYCHLGQHNWEVHDE